MANMDPLESANLTRYYGITLTLPEEYRPRYGVSDPLLQSSSEQDPLNFNPAVEDLSRRRPSVAASSRLPDQPLADGTAYAIAHTLAPGLGASAPCQSPVASWTYCPSRPDARSEVFHPCPLRGGYQRQGRGHPRHAHYRGRNDLYVGRVSMPPLDPKGLTPSTVDLKQSWCGLKSPKCPMDFFIPTIDDNPAQGALNLDEPSNTCTTWRGLSSFGAEELFAWTNFYYRVMEERRDCGYPLDNLCGIAVEMVKRYERRLPRGLNWFSSAPNIYQRVEKFLSMSMETPRMQIEELELPVAGQEYRLAPRVLNASHGFGSGLARKTVYSTSVSWLSFDPSCNVLRGIMPFAPPQSIVVKAKIVDYLDERVKLDHVVRTRVNLRPETEIRAEKYVARIVADDVMNSKIAHYRSKPKKQVSFADRHETDSLNSSPDHLRSFFDELAALTSDPAYGGSQKQLFLTTEPSVGIAPWDDIPNGSCGALGQAEAALKTSEESGTADTSCHHSASVARVARRHGIASADSSSQLYPDVRRTSSQQSQSTCDEVASDSVSDIGASASQRALLSETHSCACCSSAGSLRKVYSKMGEPSSVLSGADANLDLEAALPFPESDFGSVDNLPEPLQPTRAVFQNRFGSLSKCNNMDCPTQAYESASDSEVESRDDRFRFLQDGAFGLNSSTTKNEQFKPNPNYEDVWNDLCQWYWKGWEMEMNTKQRSCSVHSRSDPPMECSEDSLPSIINREELESRLPEDQGSKHRSIGENQNHRTWTGDQSRGLDDFIHPLTMSRATTNPPSEACLDTTWLFRDDGTFLDKMGTPTTKCVTLYDTVRNQFYMDHRVRQSCCPSHLTSSSTVPAFSSQLSSKPNRGGFTRKSWQGVTKNVAFSPAPGNEAAITSAIPTVHCAANPASLASMDERKTEVGSIAAAVKRSWETEVQVHDTRERAEIRKDILHHQGPWSYRGASDEGILGNQTTAREMKLSNQTRPSIDE